MINEFIVWDKDKKKFFNDRNDFKIDVDGDVFYKGTHFIGFDNNPIHEAFPYIGKTDDTPEANKIYADCSIVEYDYQYFAGGLEKKCRGYFHFSKEDLCYTIILQNGNSINYWKNYISNLKVIGTLQEDRHLLGEGDERN